MGKLAGRNLLNFQIDLGNGSFYAPYIPFNSLLSALSGLRWHPGFTTVAGCIFLWITIKRSGSFPLFVECFQRAAKLEPDSVWTTFGLAYQGIAENDPDVVAGIMDRLEQRVVVDGERHYRLVHFGSFLERRGAALEHLQIAIESGFFNSPYIRTDPLTVALHDHLRFKELLQTAEARHLAFRKLLTR